MQINRYAGMTAAHASHRLIRELGLLDFELDAQHPPQEQAFPLHDRRSGIDGRLFPGEAGRKTRQQVVSAEAPADR